MADVMDRWMRESINALEVMETRLAEHENAVEAAMSAIRRHTEQIEALESSIRIVRDALSNAIEQSESSGDAPATTEAAPAVPAPTRARITAAISVAQPPPPSRPMLRPVPPPPQPPEGWAAATS